jgi:hypothetical protein
MMFARRLTRLEDGNRTQPVKTGVSGHSQRGSPALGSGSVERRLSRVPCQSKARIFYAAKEAFFGSSDSGQAPFCSITSCWPFPERRPFILVVQVPGYSRCTSYSFDPHVNGRSQNGAACGLGLGQSA